jgi:hypothetical protein
MPALRLGLQRSDNQRSDWRWGVRIAIPILAVLFAAGCGTGIYENFADNVNCALYGNCGDGCDDDCDGWCGDCGGWCDGCGGSWYDFGFGFWGDGFGGGDWGGWYPGDGWYY